MVKSFNKVPLSKLVPIAFKINSTIDFKVKVKAFRLLLIALDWQPAYLSWFDFMN